MNRKTSTASILPQIMLAILFFSGCGHYLAIDGANPHRAYVAQGEAGAGAMGPGSLAEKFCPVFVVQNARRENFIGRVKAVKGENGKPEIFIDTEEPAVYFEEKPVRLAGRSFTNLIYRVHFTGTPYSLVPFILTSGKNVGVMLIVTLDENGKPVLVTTVHTCGCYAAVIPTTNLSPEYLPEKHPVDFQKVYGEKLPAMLDFGADGSLRLVAVLRPGVHRLMELSVADGAKVDGPGLAPVPMRILPAEDLRRLRVEGGGETSFFHEKGMLRGHVKGSVKPFETVLMSWMPLDLFVGTDKDLATDRTENPFYTSLKPWNRHSSDLWDFPAFLKFMGYRFE